MPQSNLPRLNRDRVHFHKGNIMERCVKYSGTALGVMLAMSLLSFSANAESIINGKTCRLLPNTGNYVTVDGQIDCYTGQFVSVAGNAGNNVGTAPGKAPSRSVEDRLKRNIHRQAGIAHDEAQAARDAFRARDWAGFREHTKAAAAAVKKVAKKARRLHRLSK